LAQIMSERIHTLAPEQKGNIELSLQPLKNIADLMEDESFYRSRLASAQERYKVHVRTHRMGMPPRCHVCDNLGATIWSSAQGHRDTVADLASHGVKVTSAA
jgi:hypothetical protein